MEITLSFTVGLVFVCARGILGRVALLVKLVTKSDQNRIKYKAPEMSKKCDAYISIKGFFFGRKGLEKVLKGFFFGRKGLKKVLKGFFLCKKSLKRSIKSFFFVPNLYKRSYKKFFLCTTCL